MTDKQERFCEEYLIDCNGAQAAIRAGYSERSAKEIASELLTKPNIHTRIAELKKQLSEKTLVDAEYVIKGFIEVANRCMEKKPVLEFNGKFMEQKKDEDGNLVWQFDSSGANRSLELLGKHVGIFDKDNSQKTTMATPTIIIQKPE